MNSWFKYIPKQRTASYCLLLISFCFSVSSISQGIRFVGEETIPLLYENSQNNKEGALLELALAVAAYTDLEATVEILPWARAYETALQEPNVILISVLKTPQREHELQWLGQVLQAEAHLIGLKQRADISINNIEQAKKYLVASVRGYGSARYLQSQGFSEKFNLVLTSHQSQMWRLLYNKRVDLVLSTLKIGRYEARYIELDPALMHSKLQVHELMNNLEFATGLSTPIETALLLRQGLSALKKDGTYAAILKKWDLH